jgi:hypothetical protein
MFFCAVSREDFLGIMQGDRVPLHGVREREYLDEARFGGDMTLLWPEAPDSDIFPSAVVLRKNEVRDFLAWVATYMTSLRPFTAFCRVADIEAARNFTRPDRHRFPRGLYSALLGLVLSETAAYIDEPGTGKNLTLKACTATYSYAMSKSLCLGVEENGYDEVASAWLRTRELTHQQKLRVPLEELLRPWKVVLALANGKDSFFAPIVQDLPSEIVRICFDLYHERATSRSSWDALGGQFPGVADLATRSEGTREQRVVQLEKAMQNLVEMKDQTTSSFLAGYLVSQIAPGTLDHFGLLKRYAHSNPSTYLWYGLCAGLHQPNNLTNFSDGLGRRILREVLRPENFLDKPKCDIALQELELLQGIQAFRTATTGQLDVEIEPCVVTSVRMERHLKSSTKPELTSNSNVSVDLIDTIRELDMLSDRVSRTREKLASIAGSPPRKVRKKYLPRP